MTSRLSFSALLLGACSGAHLPPVPAPSSVPSSSSSSAHRPWVCSTPVGALELPLPEAHGLPLVGVSVVAAVEFSFLLGFATLTAASGYKLVTSGDTLVEQFGVVTPLVGALFALVSAVLAIRWLVSYLERHDLTIFAWYRFAVAGVAVVLLLTGVI